MDKQEEQFYEIVGREVATKQFVPGLVAKAYADAEGDQKKTIALYIRLRVQQLAKERNEERARQEQAAQRDEANATRASLTKKRSCPCGHEGRLREQSTADPLVSMLLFCLGVVPAVIYTYAMTRVTCPKCGRRIRGPE